MKDRSKFHPAAVLLLCCSCDADPNQPRQSSTDSSSFQSVDPPKKWPREPTATSSRLTEVVVEGPDGSYDTFIGEYVENPSDVVCSFYYSKTPRSVGDRVFCIHYRARQSACQLYYLDQSCTTPIAMFPKEFSPSFVAVVDNGIASIACPDVEQSLYNLSSAIAPAAIYKFERGTCTEHAPAENERFYKLEGKADNEALPGATFFLD